MGRSTVPRRHLRARRGNPCSTPAQACLRKPYKRLGGGSGVISVCRSTAVFGHFPGLFGASVLAQISPDMARCGGVWAANEVCWPMRRRGTNANQRRRTSKRPTDRPVAMYRMGEYRGHPDHLWEDDAPVDSEIQTRVDAAHALVDALAFELAVLDHLLIETKTQATERAARECSCDDWRRTLAAVRLTLAALHGRVRIAAAPGPMLWSSLPPPRIGTWIGTRSTGRWRRRTS